MAVTYSQNGVIVRPNDWFGDSPNFSMYGLQQPIIEGTITNPTINSNLFTTPTFNFSQFNIVEQNIKYQILGWNNDNSATNGQYWTGNLNYFYGILNFCSPTACSFVYWINADLNNETNIDLVNGTFSINDIIEQKTIVDKQAHTVYIKFKQNGNLLLDNTYTNINVTFLDTYFSFFGLRFSGPTGYCTNAKLFLDSTNFKNENGVIWGSTKV